MDYGTHEYCWDLCYPKDDNDDEPVPVSEPKDYNLVETTEIELAEAGFTIHCKENYLVRQKEMVEWIISNNTCEDRLTIEHTTTHIYNSFCFGYCDWDQFVFLPDQTFLELNANAEPCEIEFSLVLARDGNVVEIDDRKTVTIV